MLSRSRWWFEAANGSSDDNGSGGDDDNGSGGNDDDGNAVNIS
jgi:hypothetical protein